MYWLRGGPGEAAQRARGDRGMEDAEGSEPPLRQETQEGDAGEDDPEADSEDEEEADSDEEEEEEEAEDTRGSVEDDTLENFSF